MTIEIRCDGCNTLGETEYIDLKEMGVVGFAAIEQEGWLQCNDSGKIACSKECAAKISEMEGAIAIINRKKVSGNG
jgi:hypothetical protein